MKQDVGNKTQREDEEIVNTAKKQYRRNSNSRKKKGSYRPKQQGSGESKFTNSKSNPYDWYAKNPQFTKDAGNLSFGIPLGNRIQNAVGDMITMAGIMRIQFVPTVGYSDDLDSPINRSASRFATYLRSVMKAAADYDAADIMMYMMTMDSLFMFWANMRRAYKVAQLYTPVNKYYPRRLLQMMGFDPAIADNLSEFRSYINKFALSLGQWAVPQGFTITDRHMWMCEGMYVDSETTRAQTYLFTPAGFWQYDNTVSTGSQLTFQFWQPNGATIKLHTLEEVKAFGNQLINAVTNDKDTDDISGDLFRAYGGRLRAVPETSDMDMLLPLYDKTVLSQIENLTIMGDPVTSNLSNPFTINQNPSVNNGAIIFKPCFSAGAIGVASGDETLVHFGNNQSPDRFINMHWDNPTSEQVIEATRLTTSIGVVQQTKFGTPGSAILAQIPRVMPADVVTRIFISVFNPDSPGALSNLTSETQFTLVDASTGNVLSGNASNMLQLVSLLEQFDWHPAFYIYSAATGANQYDNMLQQCWDADNVTLASANQLANMHEAAMYSLFDVPQIANTRA